MTTFTQLIDEMVNETVRPDMRGVMADYLNQTIREVHNKTGQSNEPMPVFYPDNRVEELVALSGMDDSTDQKYLWTIPKMTTFQQMEAVYYRSVSRYAQLRNSKVALGFNSNEVSARYYYYRSGPLFAFMNPGADGQYIALSWFEYPRNLPLYDAGKSPVLYDATADDYVLNAARADQTLTLDQALSLSTNWLLQKHPHVMREGLRAKIYKRMSDGSDRARLSFSQFEVLKTGIQNTESLEFTVNWGN